MCDVKARGLEQGEFIRRRTARLAKLWGGGIEGVTGEEKTKSIDVFQEGLIKVERNEPISG